MYCLLCGNKLTVIADEESRFRAWEDYDWNGTDEENMAHIEAEPTDRSTHYACRDGCKSFDEGYPLIHHHCFDHDEKGYWGGVHCHGKPGDSWSLTWIK